MKHLLRGGLTTLSHLTTLVILPVLTYRLLSNLRFLRWVRHRACAASAACSQVRGSVSVLIPARNEAATITACVESLLPQDYAYAEFIILDDHSTDSTAQQLDSIAARSPQLKVIHATGEPPVGWNGKSYACHCLAKHATGDWLLFTDADTVHAPHSIAQGIAHAQALDVDLLSVSPYQQTQSWSERLVVSFITDFLPLIGLDLEAMWRNEDKRNVVNGQYLLIRAAAYWAAGGHEAIADALVDDLR